MRTLLVFVALLALAGAAVASDWGAADPRPAKPADNSVYVQPDVPRQGGDTIADAVEITLAEGAQYTGTTMGYVNDYDEACPYTSSTAPDVVYKTTPAVTTTWDLDLCYSSYDTKIYVYDVNLNLIGCNDDAHFAAPCYTYSSKLTATLNAGMEYYIIVDGYGTANGDYVLDITEYFPCELDCPGGYNVMHENEPPLVNGYEDAYNGGCASSDFGYPFQTLECPTICGTTGFYLSVDQSQYRDTDWFYVTIPDGGVLEITGDAEYITATYQLTGDCAGGMTVVQSMDVGPCSEGTMTITGAAGSQAIFWVGASWNQDVLSNPMEWDWILYTNLPSCVIATENETWSGVKSLFR
ncbi:MAG: hypothetical protein RBT60_09350 [Candidatus Krumholzibacteria bacterium]|jgi:hypothetical protein|nr:hypothetical protein [Candidatus Krumholzibacteria bacterium]